MAERIDPYLPTADIAVLQNLFTDIKLKTKTGGSLSESASGVVSNSTNALNHDQATIARLKAINDPESPQFQPTVFVSWDEKDIPIWLNRYVVQPYAKKAASIVRHPTDVVFLTHILLYLTVNIPSAIYLYYQFTYLHGVAHVAFTLWCVGSFTLMMHNHIHNNGILSKDWAWFDFIFPYVTEPLMGHTWDSYYYHHVKHHHVEGNGPDDLSSTIRYQRDDVFHFLHYIGRFLFFIWLDLPLYFLRKGQYKLAARTACSEFGSYAFMALMTKMNPQAATFTLIIPFVVLRMGLMIGNWGQHALVDELEPDSDFRSSITLVDVPSNRFCFNDGYHTAHHLNPRRHWREQPVHFMQSKDAYSKGHALVFYNIDNLMMTFYLLRKDYMHLASCLVPIGDQIGMSQRQLADMLRTKTRKFTEADIQEKFGRGTKPTSSRPSSSLSTVLHTMRSCFQSSSNPMLSRVDGNINTRKQQ